MSGESDLETPSVISRIFGITSTIDSVDYRPPVLPLGALVVPICLLRVPNGRLPSVALAEMGVHDLLILRATLVILALPCHTINGV